MTWKALLIPVGAVIVVAASAYLVLTIYSTASEAGRRGAGAHMETPEPPPDHPRLPPSEFAPLSRPSPVVPTPSYTYVWDRNSTNQCFDPRDPDLPADAPRCPGALHIPPDPGGPKPYCPPGQALVYPNNQPTCLPTKPQ